MNKIKKIKITEPLISEIAEFAQKHGFEIYIVGGYVRDHILGRARTDFDFTIVGNAIEFAKLIAKKYSSKLIKYENFQTAMVPVKGFKVEFVGTRTEEYENHSRKPIVKSGSLTDDLKRRDFTINTLAVSLNKGTYGDVIDIFNGIEDLTEKKVLKTPLNPVVTYSDDPLRMMRAARFVAQLDFKLESNAYDSIKKCAERIRIVSQERISDEFIKIMQTKRPSLGLYVLKNNDILQYIFPELDNLSGIETVVEGNRTHRHKDVFHHTMKVLDNICLETGNVWLRFAALLHDIAKPKTKRFIKGSGWSFHGHEEIGARWIKRIFKRMRLPSDKIEYVERLVRLHQRPMILSEEGVSDSAVRRLAAKAGESLDDLFILCNADITTRNAAREQSYIDNYRNVFQKIKDVQENDKLKSFQSPVRGEEIMQVCNIKPSRLVGYIKNEIEEAILDGIVPNEYAPAAEYFTSMKEKWIAKFNSKGK